MIQLSLESVIFSRNCDLSSLRLILKTLLRGVFLTPLFPLVKGKMGLSILSWLKVKNISALFIITLSLNFVSAHSRAHMEKPMVKPDKIACSVVECDEVKTKTQILTETQIKALKDKFSFKKKPRPLVQTYILKNSGKIAGYGIVDTHIVRTKSESLLFVFSPTGELLNIEVLAFFEPPEYKPSDNLLKVSQNYNNKLGQEISIQTGATLTSYALDKARFKAAWLWQLFYGSNKDQ